MDCEVTKKLFQNTLDKLNADKHEAERIAFEKKKKRLVAEASLNDNIEINKGVLRAVQGIKNINKQIEKKSQEALRQELLKENLLPDQIFLEKKRLADYEKRKVTFNKQRTQKHDKIVNQIMKEEQNSLHMKSKRSNLHWMDRNNNNNYKLSRAKSTKLPSVFTTATNLRKSTSLGHLPPLSSDLIFDKSKIQSNDSDANISQYEMLCNRNDFTMNTELLQPKLNDLWVTPSILQSDKKNYSTSKKLISDDKIKKAMTKLKENIISKQVVAGKEFNGQAFCSQPGEVIFKDFQIDAVYSKKVYLTNVSYSVNYCKFTHLSDNLQDFCMIEFDPPGSLSAGLTCWFRVQFTPTLNIDLEGTINFLAQTGPFSVSLKCFSKKCIITLEKEFVDFGKLCIGEKLVKSCLIKNMGILSTNFKVTPCVLCKKQNEMTNQINKQNETQSSESSCTLKSDTTNRTIICTANDGNLSSYSETCIEFEFLPIEIGIDSQDFIISFSREELEPIMISLMGESISQPLFFETDKLDFKICITGCLYQDSITIHNKAKNSQNIHFDIPHSLQEFLTVSPVQGLVQGGNKLSLQLQFIPTEAIGSVKNKNHFNNDTGELHVTLNCRVREQSLPLLFTLTARVTKAELKFNKNNINFGICHIQESVFIPLEVTNECFLPQRIGFIHLPNCISVTPNDGFLTLLPNETCEIAIAFHPDKIRNYELYILCKTQYNKDYHISCTGRCIQSGLKLSYTQVCFAPTVIGDFTFANLEISNPKTSRLSSAKVRGVAPYNTPRIFQFEVPPEVPIKITPSIGKLNSGQIIKCLIEFSPCIPPKETNLALDLAKEDLVTSTEAASKTSLIYNSNSNLTSRKLSKNMYDKVIQQNHQIEVSESLLYPAKTIKEFKEKTESIRIACFVSDATKLPSFVKEETLYIDITIKSLPLKLVLKGLTDSYFDFGPCLTGMKVCKRLVLENLSSSVVDFTHDILDTTGPFEIMNVPRSIPPGETFALILNFLPEEEEEYLEEIQIRCSIQYYIPFRLTGSGIQTHFKLTDSSNNELGEFLDLGDVINNESCENQIILYNSSSLPFSYTCNLTESDNSLNLTGSTAFEIRPFNGVIGANSKLEINVIFRPDRVSLLYKDELHININNNSPIVIQLKARSHEMNLYLEKDINSIFSRDLLIPQPQQRYTEHYLSFDYSGSKESSPINKVLRIGNIKHRAPGYKGNGEFIFDFDGPVSSQNVFVIETMKSHIETGTIVDVKISFDHKKVPKDCDAVLAYYRLILKGDITKTHKILLSGTVNLL